MSSTNIICPHCHGRFGFISNGSQQNPKFCVFCQGSLQTQNVTKETQSTTFIPGHIPESEKVLFEVGRYQILDSIGQGGMGEVFLAYDVMCGRRIALKRIRPDLAAHSQLHPRFLKEARITSQLTHPGIIPIYAIQNEQELAYYTMPFIEGQTLKEILIKANESEKNGVKPDHASSILALSRIFLSVCHAIAYAHSKGVIHRDLKPANIMLGNFGEVFVLDWGLAKVISPQMSLDAVPVSASPDDEESPHKEITHFGRVVGTIAYMAPERALGNPASYSTDIYSLGVVLYQILTLKHPFHRKSLQEFRKYMQQEILADPAEVAPYRDVPPVLASIACKCLAFKAEERYHSLNELIHDLESYIEGRSEWVLAAELDVQRKSDWEFQENILIAEHIAITRGTDISDWVSLMISKESFSENTKIEATVRLGEQSHGLGFLLSVPEAAERAHWNSGYCLWIASDLSKTTKLMRSAVDVVYATETLLQRGIWYNICIEKVEDNIHFYINDILQFSYTSHLPLSGTHLGLLSRDGDFLIKDFDVYIGSQNIKVNCLAVPDAFLAHKAYHIALSEYRRIGHAFPGTAEGREALFRAGITLLEEARSQSDPHMRQAKSNEALDEFGKLHRTAGAPLEYLGKALVYQELHDYDEEMKCFELAFRRYPRHPLLHVLQEHLVHRMHETSRHDRLATYQFALLAVRYLPQSNANHNVGALFHSLKRHWEPLYFIEEIENNASQLMQNQLFAIQLAFWLAKPYVLVEIIDELAAIEPLPSVLIGNALFALLELGAKTLVTEKLTQLEGKLEEQRMIFLKAALQQLNLPTVLPTLIAVRTVYFLMQQALTEQHSHTVLELYDQMAILELSPPTQIHLDCFRIWAYLTEKNWQKADDLLHQYSLEQLTHETSPLHFLYGCWLVATEGKEIAFIHFSSVLEMAFPRSYAILSHFLQNNERNQRWMQQAFLWEKRQLYQQSALFHLCAGEEEQYKHFLELAKSEYVESVKFLA